MPYRLFLNNDNDEDGDHGDRIVNDDYDDDDDDDDGDDGEDMDRSDPHICRYCGNVLKSKSSLRQHEISHTGTGKGYTCCDKVFFSKANLNRHRPSLTNTFCDAGGAPMRDPGSTGMNRGSTRNVRDEPVTGPYRKQPARHREQPGQHRSSTGTNRGLSEMLLTPAELRQRPGLTPSRCSYVSPINAAPVSYGYCLQHEPGVTGTYREQPARHREQPGQHRISTGMSPELCRDATGFHRDATDYDRDSPGYDRNSPG
ncbi:hypothetical protein DPMN_108930 [Dreissena polymorpha]|uniref:C2H2-type domain-containing protein n=1 Tax=Dreissena polymorpha TaxID=45954 RepID=A0A9D4QLG5_DREPO|nr:hypothetical protein DPMN_108930 [Dreissena polymorpha]